MSALISRDPFARTELLRSSIAISANQTCSNCGGLRYRNGKPIPSLFQYQTESDSGRKNTHNGLFCGKDCHDSYHF